MPLPDLSTINLPLTINGFSCSELPESASGVIDGSNSTAVRIFHVKFSEHAAFISSFLPSASMVNGVLTFTQGATFPWNNLLVAVRGRFEGLGTISPTGPNSAIEYPLARVVIEYISNESILTLGSGQPPMRRTDSGTISGEMLELPKGCFRFATAIAANNVPIDQAQGLIIPHTDYIVTEENVPTENWDPAYLIDRQGKMNNDLFKYGTALYPAGFAIYLGTAFEQTGTISIFGVNGQQTIITRLWKLTHQFKLRRERWDKIYHPALKTFEKVDPSPYPPINFGPNPGPGILQPTL